MKASKHKKSGLRIAALSSVVAVLLAACVAVLLSCSDDDDDEESYYGLASTIQEGLILHCFNWSYSQITEELEGIARAGFTAVQTSPAQKQGGSGQWYWLYQPLGFYLGENALGTVEELETLCSKAHKYGIYVIVDVVANHLSGTHTNIQDDLKADKYWHTYGSTIDYSNRYAVTHGDIGMTDLATENTYVQSCVLSYLKELVDAGVDGIRWDAAKHIDLPSEDEESQFWPAMTTESGLKTKLGNDLWHYGEILYAPANNSEYYDLMDEYTNYISVTDDEYGNDIRGRLAEGSLPTGYVSANWTATDYGVDDDEVVYWAESHDTYANDGGASKDVDVNVIDRTWAIVASRNDSTALYLSRPEETDNNKIYMGVKGSTHYKSAEVAAVNHFHNACVGQNDYFTSQDGVISVCRRSGAVIVLASGENQEVEAVNGGGYTRTGTYKDEISGNTFTVTETTITGKVGSTGIAVIYD